VNASSAIFGIGVAPFSHLRIPRVLTSMILLSSFWLSCIEPLSLRNCLPDIMSAYTALPRYLSRCHAKFTGFFQSIAARHRDQIAIAIGFWFLALLQPRNHGTPLETRP